MGRGYWGRRAVAACVGVWSLFSVASCGSSPPAGENSTGEDAAGGGPDGFADEMDASILPADAAHTPPRSDANSTRDEAGEGVGTDATVPDGGSSTDATAAEDASGAETGAADDSLESAAPYNDASGGGTSADATVDSTSVDDNDGGAGSDSAEADATDDATLDSAGSGDAASPADAGADSGGALPDAGAGDACTPATKCPTGVECGRWTDPCSGKRFACGTPCVGSTVCVASPTDPDSQSCQPKGCAGACGVIGDDSCGVAISCPACAPGFECVNATCVPATDAGAGSCADLTCAPNASTNLCGTVTDGCGHTRSCSCPAGQSCVAGVCQTEPPECTSAFGALCGSIPNACGSGNAACGQCSGASECIGNLCVGCTPPSCGSATCGQVNNGCGPAVACGTCPGNEVCTGGSCCTPKTCADAMDAGLVTGCGPINLGCGVSRSCSSCPAGDVCSKNVCTGCTPKTCSDFGNAGCGHSDGCGNTLNCCGAGTVCDGTICCAPGRVNYGGGCCEPTCDPNDPRTIQTSCGQIIDCVPS